MASLGTNSLCFFLPVFGSDMFRGNLIANRRALKGEPFIFFLKSARAQVYEYVARGCASLRARLNEAQYGFVRVSTFLRGRKDETTESQYFPPARYFFYLLISSYLELPRDNETISEPKWYAWHRRVLEKKEKTRREVRCSVRASSFILLDCLFLFLFCMPVSVVIS